VSGKEAKMRVIENPKVSARKPSNRWERFWETLKLGRGWFEDMQAQDVLIASLGKVLDNRFVLLRNVTLEGLDVPIPVVLVGPPGVWVFYPSALRGLFRARGDVWEGMDSRQEVFRPALPNLITRTQLMAQAVAAFFAARNLTLPTTEPVLFFSEPGTHVETIRPAVRIVLVDGLERFIVGMLQSRVWLERDEVEKAVDLLIKSMGLSEKDLLPYPEKDVFSFVDEREAAGIAALAPLSPGERLAAALHKIPFSGRQWLLLGCLVLINVVVLIAFLILVLITS
jgi:hypothetical protein